MIKWITEKDLDDDYLEYEYAYLGKVLVASVEHSYRHMYTEINYHLPIDNNQKLVNWDKGIKPDISTYKVLLKRRLQRWMKNANLKYTGEHDDG